MIRAFADYHTHTRYSHGKGSIEDNVKAALAMGLEEIGIADHGPASHSIRRLGVKRAETLLDIKNEIKRLQKAYPQIRILAGVEANIISADGTIDVPYKILCQLDKILVGFHLMVIPKSWQDGKKLIYDNIINYRIHKDDREAIRYQNTRAVIKAVNRYPIDVITHPGFQIDIDTIELAKACKKNDTALEINVSHGYLTEEFVKAAAAEGAKFVISSDAHRPEDVGQLSEGLRMVQNIGLSNDQILNIH
mgnify:CR=1 FL=1